ncbi:zinc-ribbon domain-containing protein [Paracoccus stylophorae]|uniref:Zinc-ribbon domain-containing protein n=1 Tax=Paracoccus stylophorae TaxID=659350 RepID=A0ABY7SWW9_9RHOB|nr:zinc-ribbon domain-containing protein [Paracoccus stylophorae]WCR11441.1 zinc-ribbon domain-containing protein [Paracoccus stylophorae]
MAEIRLICPGCAAEYLLPEGTIPARGRQVECTACGQVWQATPGDRPPDLPQARPKAGAEQLSYTLAFGESAKVQRDPDRTGDASQSGSAAAAPAAKLSRRVPESVLSILRDEVEHERRARAAETGTDTGTQDGNRPARHESTAHATGIDWPATTVTDTPASGAGSTRPAPDRVPAPSDPEAQPVVAPAGATRAMVGAPFPQPDPAVDLDLPKPAGTAPAAPDTPFQPAMPVPADGPSGYRTGFGLAVAIAATGLVLYLLAPAMSDAGPVGAAMQDLRAFVDQGRLWLQSGIFGRSA